MNNWKIRRLIVIGFLVLCSLASGCNGRQGEGGVEGYYQLPLIPIKVSYDFVSKKLKVAISGQIQTPIGTFGVTASVGSSPKQFNGVRTLTLETGTRKYVYQLERGKRYSINLPSDENGEAKVVYSGTDENLSIVIPNPTNETVGELRRKLKEEQEARERAEAGVRDGDEPDETYTEEAAEAERQRAQDAEDQRERERIAQDEAYRRQLELERQRREAAELREQQSQQREQEAQRRAQEAERQAQEARRQREEMADRRRDEEAERQRREEERRRRRNEELLRLGINTAREVLRRRN